MQCLSPITIKSKNVACERKFGQYMQVPCGKCEACISKKRKDWLIRLRKEEKNSILSYFVTLTYDDDNIPINSKGYPTFNKRDIQLFLKKLRFRIDELQSNIPKDCRLRLRYFLIGEYGSKRGRPHYHALFFNVLPDNEFYKFNRLVHDTWNKGRTSCAVVNNNRIGYCANYMYGKSDIYDDEFIDVTNRIPLMCSLKPAIGSCYLTKDVVEYHIKNRISYIDEHGIKYGLPRYYKDKIFIGFDKITIDVLTRKYLAEEKQKQRAEDIEYLSAGKNPQFLPSTLKAEKFKRHFYWLKKKHNSHPYNNEDI